MRSNSSSAARGGLLAGLALVALSCETKVTAQTPDHHEDSYMAGDRLVPLLVHRHQVGVVLDEGVPHADLLALVPSGTVHAPPADESLGGLLGTLHVLDPAGEHDRDQLTSITGEYQAHDPRVIEHAGMLVYHEGSDTPMLMTHEFIVQFDASATEAQIVDLVRKHGVLEVRASEHDTSQRLLATAPGMDMDALEACRLFVAEPLVEFCEPNFVYHVDYLSRDLNDTLIAKQWHHENTGQGGGTKDADIDTPLAWDFTIGLDDVVIAVLENGFDVEHPDLELNLWSKPGEPEVHGRNFEDKNADLYGDPKDRGATSHGTAVAGCAAAQGNNDLGVSGSCPECSLMLLRRPNPPSVSADADAIRYAWNNGADIISNSWTYTDRQPVHHTIKHALNVAMKEGRDGKGCVVLFAVQNTYMNVDGVDQVAALEGLLTIGSVTNTDERVVSCGWGDSVDVLGPSRLSMTPNKAAGTLNIATTDWRGVKAGYNDEPAMQVEMDPGNDPCADLSNGDYTQCFGGNSAATPIVAGVVGLLLSVDPGLRREEVIHVLRNTTDRMQDTDFGNYSDYTGRSTENAHGRVNAFEAVRLVAPRGDKHGNRGRGGIDVFVRDNRLDWGNTEQPSHVLFEKKRGVIGSWQSSDIKIDAPDSSSGDFSPPPASSGDFDALATEGPRAGETNRVYVRVRNRGPRIAESVRVHLYVAEAGTSLPALPQGFRTGGGDDSGAWTSLGTRKITEIEHSGASVAGGKEDRAQVVSFDFAAPARPPGEDAASHHAFLAVVECDEDRVSGDPALLTAPCRAVATDNNVTLRNVHTWKQGGSATIHVRNASTESVTSRIEAVAPKGTQVQVEPVASARRIQLGEDFDLQAGEGLLVRVRVTGSVPEGSFDLRQLRVDGDQRVLMGGITFEPARSSK